MSALPGCLDRYVETVAARLRAGETIRTREVQLMIACPTCCTSEMIGSHPSELAPRVIVEAAHRVWGAR
jgi:hypothetical protein